jgi:hypothetical protein
VDIPCCFLLDGTIWLQVREGVRGVLLHDRDRPHVYVLLEPATHYYRTMTRSEGHVAYYRFWREGGRLRKRYLKRADLAAVRAACEARRQERRELVKSWEQWRQLVAVVREETA